MNPMLYLVALIVLVVAIIISAAIVAVRRNRQPYHSGIFEPPVPRRQATATRPRSRQLHYQRSKAMRAAEANLIMAALQAGVAPREIASLLRGSVSNNYRKIQRAKHKIAHKAIERTVSVLPVKTHNTPFDTDEGIQRRPGNVLAALCDGSRSGEVTV